MSEQEQQYRLNAERKFCPFKWGEGYCERRLTLAHLISTHGWDRKTAKQWLESESPWHKIARQWHEWAIKPVLERLLKP